MKRYIVEAKLVNGTRVSSSVWAESGARARRIFRNEWNETNGEDAQVAAVVEVSEAAPEGGRGG